eukprot:TRINITY_DN1268_c0_g3_i4.p1 TRINITY_DN1268_c0_g3~~TRINITY_DN1268_c0_g3_i4.p1  ORF type:complete len:415 (+),score=173.65 TRINITY_DN1268_c0_g3_i4:144-1388(+)
MLMKYAKVDKDGNYTKPVKAQIAYAALIGGRVHMVDDSSYSLQKALTISVRYAAIRRQFPNGSNGNKERQILDYQSHKYRLMPLISGAFALHFAGKRLRDEYFAVMESIESGKPNLRMLSDLHSISCGLKAWCTWYTKTGLEDCRQSCGGHGYSAYAELASILNDFAVQCTWEGDNTVICQQSAKSVMKMMQKAMAGTEMAGSVAYLGDVMDFMDEIKAEFSSGEELRDTKLQLDAHQLIACKRALYAGEKLQEMMGDGMDQLEAWNANLVDLIDMSRHHTYHYITTSFARKVEATTDKDLQKILKLLLDLWSLKNLDDNKAILLECGWIDGEQSQLIHEEVLKLCDEVRDQAIPIIDSFNIMDFIHKSPLGAYDGNIYERYFARVNAARPTTDDRGVPPYYEKLIRPLTKAKL